MKKRYLTKSRFKLALECPTKLFYTNKKAYPNSRLDDPFLEALAQGGYQVGELAKMYYQPGHNIETLDYEEAERQTNDLLKKQNVTIFEPAIRHKNFFIRIDILVKKGNKIDLIEVKAKSYDSNVEEEQFIGKRSGELNKSWKPFLCDIAFQKFVLQSAHPEFEITSFLLMADKNVRCPTEGLNQKFRIVRDENSRKGIKVAGDLSKEDLQREILIKVPVDEYVEMIIGSKDILGDGSERTFEQEVEFLASAYEKDKKIISEIGGKCNQCEFVCSLEEEKHGLKNGFKECWKYALEWEEKDFQEENILTLWNFRGKDKFIKAGKLKLADLEETDILPKSDDRPGISSSERQWLQIEKSQNKDSTPFFDKDGMLREMKRWTFPLHFIDFETTAVAIPFNKGRRPYEGIAFQFSHHVVQENGAIEHAGQYLNIERGKFPNYDFVRALKKQLEKDDGTIFRYAAHENTYLNMINQQLCEDKKKIEDKEDLCRFIASITSSSGTGGKKREGRRAMVDMLELVKRYYYDPYTHGSNSIKYVLPAVLNSSEYLQGKYSNPIYGASNGIKSLNFKDWVWIKFKGKDVCDPYKLLPKLFQDVSSRNQEIISTDDELRDGGAAMTAYARMQFAEMSDYERDELAHALLKYCELDTMAMVMIYEAWREWGGGMSEEKEIIIGWHKVEKNKDDGTIIRCIPGGGVYIFFFNNFPFYVGTAVNFECRLRRHKKLFETGRRTFLYVDFYNDKNVPWVKILKGYGEGKRDVEKVMYVPATSKMVNEKEIIKNGKEFWRHLDIYVGDIRYKEERKIKTYKQVETDIQIFIKDYSIKKYGLEKKSFGIMNTRSTFFGKQECEKRSDYKLVNRVIDEDDLNLKVLMDIMVTR